jgi:hypothetical protein
MGGQRIDLPAVCHHDLQEPANLWRTALTWAFLPYKIMDIFEGTDQIRQLVISRAISGLRIE